MELEGLVYLASPYTHQDPDVREARFEAACQCAVAFITRGVYIFSPVVHCHPLTLMGMPQEWAHWEEYDRALLNASSSLVALTMNGSVGSVGMNEEWNIMRSELARPVYIFDGPFGGAGELPALWSQEEWLRAVDKFLSER